METEPNSEELTDWERVQLPSNSSVAVQEGSLAESSAFLPQTHEDLLVKSAPEDNNEGGPEATNSQSSKKMRPGSVLCGWITWMARGVGANAVLRVGFWTFAALVAVSLLRRRMVVWRKKLQLKRGKESLLALIKDQEKRINQLLLQISQMNDVLRARRRVPVLRANQV